MITISILSLSPTGADINPQMRGPGTGVGGVAVAVGSWQLAVGSLPGVIECSRVAVGREKRVNRREQKGKQGPAQKSTKSLQYSFFSRLRPTGGVNLGVELQNEIATAPAGPRNDGSPRRSLTVAARDDRLLRYVAGIFMRWEYKETERDCRSRGARYS